LLEALVCLHRKRLEKTYFLKQLLYKLLLLVALIWACSSHSDAQSDSAVQKAASILNRLSDKTLNSIQKKYHKLQTKIASYSKHSLERMEKEEQKLQKKLASNDSLGSKSSFGSIKEKYADMIQRTQNPAGNISGASLNEYLPGLDSLQTTFAFLEKTGLKIPGVPAEKLAQIQGISAQLKSLQAQVQTTGNIKKFLQERKQILKDQFDKLEMPVQLKNVNKQVYYYQAQINEYKSLINDPEKLEKKLLSMVRDVPAFKDFISKNSLLAQLFLVPSGYGTADALVGLQTRAVMQQQLTQRMGAGANPQQYLQQQVSLAQNELNGLKDKVNKLGGGGSDMAMPEFKPNNQKTKSFWNRIEYGLNVQSQKTNALLPVTSDIALTAGYKLNDKSTVGVGTGYKLGWGNNISNIHITSQGISLRSYVDIKMKGSIWITGGYEYNYQQEFEKLDQLKDVNAWQKSGLIGLTKKYKVGKKTGNLQLLWDFLSYSQIPKTQALKFRIGYGF
jgi:hypothetical protein